MHPGALGQLARINTVAYGGVSGTVANMQRLAREALIREQGAPIQRLVREIVAKVPGKDYLSQVAACYYWVLQNSQYLRDPLHVERVQSPLVLLQPQPWDRAAGRRAGADDCETQAVTLAAMVMALGNSASYVTISTDPRRDYHHVFTVANVDGKSLVLDPVPGPHVMDMLRRVVKSMEWRIEPVRRRGMAPGQWGVSGLGGIVYAGPGNPPNLRGILNQAGRRVS